jgi:hypothetical protein
MLTTTTIGMFGGLGLTWTAGPDFSCMATADGDSICYAKAAANDAIVRQFQSLLNRYAKALGFTVLAVDGKIGKLTRDAIGTVAQYVFGKTPNTASDAVLRALADSHGVINMPDIRTLNVEFGKLAPSAPTTTATPSPQGVAPKASMSKKWTMLGVAAGAAVVVVVGSVVAYRSTRAA